MPVSASPTERWLTDAMTSGPAAAAYTPSPVRVARPPTAQVAEDVVAAADPAPVGATSVEPDAPLPVGFAKLTVSRVLDPAGQELFGVAGESDVGPLPFTVTDTQLRPPDIGLGNVSGEGQFPSEIWRAILRWSENQRPLTQWITDLRARHGDGLQLIVWDDTDYDIPWELLWLCGDPAHGLAAGCLGALVNVIRWTTIREVGRPPLEPAECSGSVLAYFDEPMLADKIAFQAFINQFYSAVGPFLNELDQQSLRAGLVYMGCHGEYGSSVYRLLLDNLTWGELADRDMAAIREWRTVVCLNACHSGRLIRNTGQGEEALRGFAELFLRKGAYGCIAIAGKVGDGEAHALIVRLMEEVTATPRLPVALALRRFRQQAASSLPWELTAAPRTRNDDGSVNTTGQKETLGFLYSFMFLYYGHPLTTLRLNLRRGDGLP